MKGSLYIGLGFSWENSDQEALGKASASCLILPPRKFRVADEDWR